MKKIFWILAFLGLVLGLVLRPADAGFFSIGPNGINSVGLTLADGVTPLTGSGIGIGQIESGRPGKRIADGGFDNAAHSATTIKPTEVFVRTTGGAGIANMNTTEHGSRVAGVMISTDAVGKGVATGAKLYSSAIAPMGVPDFDAEVAITAQHVVTRNNGDIRALNMSFANPLFGSDELDGNAPLTLFVDWSASHHNVLYVQAGNQVPDTNSVPTDNFNGIVVAASMQVGGTGKYREVRTENRYDFDAVGARTSVSLLAPGDNIDVIGLGNTPGNFGGTSYAAPHVTGTVALLQEYGDQRISVGAPQWNATSPRRHEVMKAVLLNSADKLIDNGSVMVNNKAVPPGYLLGMERTVIDKDGKNWLESEAYTDVVNSEFLPFDDQMGAGHLNAKRALQQFAPGEFNADGSGLQAGPIGWDYGTTTGADDINKYGFGQRKLLKDTFISITIAFDRKVVFDFDADLDGEYDVDDAFVPSNDPITDDQISDLDIYLVPKGAFGIDDAVAESISSDSTVDHIFFQIPETEEYEIWVHQWDDDVGPQSYGIAWWAVFAPADAQPGDFDGDGDVDGADFVVWQTNFPTQSGATLATGDADGDGDVDGADFVIWQTNFPFTPSAAVPVPEPVAVRLFAMAVPWLLLMGRRRRC